LSNKIKAAKTDVSMAEICRRALEERVAKDPPEKPQRQKKEAPQQ